MPKKPDIVMLLGGAFAVAIGAALVLSELSPFNASGWWVLPAALAVGGVGVLAAVRLAARGDEPRAATAGSTTSADVDPDLLAAAHADLRDVEQRVARVETLPASWPRTADPAGLDEEIER